MSTFAMPERKEEKNWWSAGEIEKGGELTVRGEFCFTDPVKMDAFVARVLALQARLKGKSRITATKKQGGVMKKITAALFGMMLIFPIGHVKADECVVKSSEKIAECLAIQAELFELMESQDYSAAARKNAELAQCAADGQRIAAAC